MHRILCILLAALCSFTAARASAISEKEVASNRYSVQIDLANAGISGVCIVREMQERVVGAIINEFGVSALSFDYDPGRERVKIVDILPQLDKWYIKRVLREDLKRIIPEVAKLPSEGRYEYNNKRRNIRYRFVPITEI